MATWLSRTIKRLAGNETATSAEPPLPPAELREIAESARKLMAQGDHVDAQQVLVRAVNSNPDDAQVLALYGVASFQAGDPDEARKALTRAVRFNPDDLVASKFLVFACNALGDSYGVVIGALNALRLAPDDREVLNLHGIACMNRHQIDEAAESFSKVVEMAPTDLTPLVNIESLSIRSLRHRRTLERSPKIATARSQAINRLRAQHRRGQLDDDNLRYLLMLLAGAKETFQSAVELAQEFAGREQFAAELADQLAIVFHDAGDVANYLRFCQLAAEANPGFGVSWANLGQARLAAGAGSWQDNWEAIFGIERYYNLAAVASEVPTWTGQRIGKKKLLVHAEQGVGDAILSLRLVPMLAQRGVRFDLWVQPSLAGLAASVKGYENLVRADRRPDAKSLGCDYAITLFGLISVLRVGYKELMQSPTRLVPAVDRLPEVRTRLRTLAGKRVGLAYGGNHERRDDWYRAVPPAALKPLSAIEGITWVNLVIDPRPEREEVIRMFQMIDPMKEVTDFEDSAAIISELDAVIAIDSSTAHLAASLGKPEWVLVPPMVDWRWQMGSDKSPWWPNVTLLRSPKPGEWAETIRDLAKQVAAWRG
jgi:tetratricopeptide (TPR) repeat protein